MPPPRGKTRVEWRGGAPAAPGYVHDASYLRRKKRVGESPVREKGSVWCEGEKEYETEQLKLGTVPVCAYNIRQKFVNASRDLPAAFRPARLHKVPTNVS